MWLTFLSSSFQVSLANSLLDGLVLLAIFIWTLFGVCDDVEMSYEIFLVIHSFLERMKRLQFFFHVHHLVSIVILTSISISTSFIIQNPIQQYFSLCQIETIDKAHVYTARSSDLFGFMRRCRGGFDCNVCKFHLYGSTRVRICNSYPKKKTKIFKVSTETESINSGREAKLQQIKRR